MSHESAVEYLELHDVLGPNVIGSKCEVGSKWKASNPQVRRKDRIK